MQNPNVNNTLRFKGGKAAFPFNATALLAVAAIVLCLAAGVAQPARAAAGNSTLRAGQELRAGRALAAETSTEIAAVRWAESMVGSAAGTSGHEYWYGCLAFAINAYVIGASYAIRHDISVTIGDDTYPAQVWDHFRTGTTGGGNNPPAGALVFWDSTGGTADSHVAISVGNGKLVSTNVDQPGVPGHNGIHYETMAQFASNSWNIYKGWWLPDK